MNIGDLFRLRNDGPIFTVMEDFAGGCNKRILVHKWLWKPCDRTYPHMHVRDGEGQIFVHGASYNEVIVGHDPFLGLRVGDKYLGTNVEFGFNSYRTIQALCDKCKYSAHPHLHVDEGWDEISTALACPHLDLIDRYGNHQRTRASSEAVVESAHQKKIQAKEILTKIIKDLPKNLPPPWPGDPREQATFFFKNPPKHVVSAGGVIDPRLPVVLAKVVEDYGHLPAGRFGTYEELRLYVESCMENMLTPKSTFTKRMLK